MRKCLQVFLVLLVSLMVSGCQQEQMKLKNKELTVEYGEIISSDLKTYLENSDEYMKNSTMTGIPENEEGKEYPAVGEYTLKISHGNTNQEVTIKVEDTKAPTFTDGITKVTVDNGEKIDKKKFTATDLSDVTITVEDGQIDYTKSGNYKVKVTATDEYQNKAQKEIDLTVKKRAVTASKNTTSKSSSKGSTTNQSSNKTNNSSSSQKGSFTSNKPASSNSSSTSNKNTGTSTGTSGSSSSSSNDLWVSKLDVAKSYSKIMIASAPSSSSRQGTFTYYQKVNGKWKEVLETTADFGKAGVGTGSENSTRTPIGQYTFTKLMGISSNPGTNLAYHKIDSNDYWCGETLYNQFVDEDVTEHHCSKKNDEHLIDYPSQYKYAAAFSYNASNVKGKGFAFFLHCANSIHYTGGCVAIPTSQMKKVMQAIDSNTVFIIDLKKNITKY